jgi:hypothetical protein
MGRGGRQGRGGRLAERGQTCGEGADLRRGGRQGREGRQGRGGRLAERGQTCGEGADLLVVVFPSPLSSQVCRNSPLSSLSPTCLRKSPQVCRKSPQVCRNSPSPTKKDGLLDNQRNLRINFPVR